MKEQLATLAERSKFDEIIDVRTPLEFAEDHLPGAINAPVLSNEERVIVGTLYKQDPFAATKMGAAMVARNIAHHLDTLFSAKPLNYKPLVYCWRGGKRSGSLTAWLRLIGFKAAQLQYGYKGYREWVREQLELQPGKLRYCVIGGHTGSGKTRLLQALAEQGGQVLDLEGLAKHRGSVLGALPGVGQPTQKAFDSALLATLNGFDPAQTVFVEAESKRVGILHMPPSLMQAMHSAPCVRVEAEHGDRIKYLCQDYGHLFETPELFKLQLNRLLELHGKEVIAHWHGLIDAGLREALFAELIDRHYDPAYRRGSPDRYLAEGVTLQLDPNAVLESHARQLLERSLR